MSKKVKDKKDKKRAKKNKEGAKAKVKKDKYGKGKDKNKNKSKKNKSEKAPPIDVNVDFDGIWDDAKHTLDRAFAEGKKLSKEAKPVFQDLVKKGAYGAAFGSAFAVNFVSEIAKKFIPDEEEASREGADSGKSAAKLITQNSQELLEQIKNKSSKECKDEGKKK